MADINFTDVAKKETSFHTDGVVRETIANGQTGVLLSLPEVPGKSYKITELSTSAGSEQDGISLLTNGVAIEDEETLADSSPTNQTHFFVSSTFSSSSIFLGKMYKEVNCDSFSIEKNAGNTDQNIICVYEIGEYR